MLAFTTHLSPDRARRLSWTAVGALGVVLLMGCAGTTPNPPGSAASASGSTASDQEAGGAAAGGSSAGIGASKPARVCGSDSLAGPSEAPAGARVVRSGTHLGQVANRAPEGATFWLAPGVHTLGTDRYDQVVPKNDQVFIGAPGAVLDGQNLNKYAFTGQATGVRISHLTITKFGASGDNNNEGVVNHDSGHGWRIEHNTVEGNAGAGVFLGSGGKTLRNCLTANGQYGFSAYEPSGVRNVVLRGNEVSGNNVDDWEARQPDCGCSGGGKFWDTDRADIVNNWVHDNRGTGLWADTNNRDFLVKGNLISNNDGEGFFYETSYNAKIVRNTFLRNGIKEGPDNPGFPTAAIYLSESGSEPRVGGRFGQRLKIAKNRFVDNWSAIMAWENPDRFAGSPANTSSGYTTLANPSVATLEACGTPGLIGKQPYFDDCRWKTQNVRVAGNTFILRPDRIPGCEPSAGCGYVGLMSNYGTFPDWSPYMKYVVPDNITRNQGNRWAQNRYVGPWHYVVRTLGNDVTWKSWRGEFGQDAESTRD